MDGRSSAVQVVDVSSSDDDPPNHSAGNRGQVEDAETTSDGSNEAASPARYSVSLFSVTAQMDTIPSDDNREQQSSLAAIEVGVFSRR